MEYTMVEHEANMTFYYSKSTGILKNVVSGINGMSVFGVDEEDYSQIWAFKVIPKDDYVLQNPDKFIVDLSTGDPILSLKQESINQYPVI